MGHPFGWDYPPGAATDPSAPYNQKDPEPCPECDGEGIFSQDGERQRCADCGHEWTPKDREGPEDDGRDGDDDEPEFVTGHPFPIRRGDP